MLRTSTIASCFASALALLSGCGDDTGGAGGGSGGSGAGGSDVTASSGSGNGSGNGSGTGSGTGSGSTASTGEGGGLLAFGSACTSDGECESGLCYVFGMGSKCTVPCPADPADCPGDTKECNNMDPAACKTP